MCQTCIDQQIAGMVCNIIDVRLLLSGVDHKWIFFNLSPRTRIPLVPACLALQHDLSRSFHHFNNELFNRSCLIVRNTTYQTWVILFGIRRSLYLSVTKYCYRNKVCPRFSLMLPFDNFLPCGLIVTNCNQCLVNVWLVRCWIEKGLLEQRQCSINCR